MSGMITGTRVLHKKVNVKRILFIDRDGTVIQEPDDEQVDSFAKLRFLPGAISALSRIKKETDFLLVMVTNQDGLGTESFPETDFWPVHNKMLEILEDEGVVWDEICIDPHLPEDNAPTRKPGTAMLTHYLKGDYDLSNSFVLGDRESDMQLAANLGARGIFLGAEHPDAVLATTDWQKICTFLKRGSRQTTVTRNTRETDIRVCLDLNGTGKSDIRTGLHFFDHMLDQVARHGGVDLEIKVDGDLHVDEHHTIEDTGLALGEAFSRAMGQKKGMMRYAFVLPMDDCLAQVAIDFGGRPWLEWNVPFHRDYIGDVPTEMFHHFFKSFTDTARCNLNIQATGENQHHKIEAVFKGFARCIQQAIALDDSGQVASTKGRL